MKKENLVSVPFMVLGIVFCVCLVAANLLETKVVQLGPISVTAGLIVFPISYIINDCIAEVWGFRKARLIIWMGFQRGDCHHDQTGTSGETLHRCQRRPHRERKAVLR